MRRLRAFGAFWYDFVVGDDWRIALGVVLALGATAALVAAGVNAWWLPCGCGGRPARAVAAPRGPALIVRTGVRPGTRWAGPAFRIP